MDEKGDFPPPYTQQSDFQPPQASAPQQYPAQPQGQAPYVTQPQGQNPYAAQPQGQNPYPQGQNPYPQGQSPYQAPPQGQSPYPAPPAGQYHGPPGGTFIVPPGGAPPNQPWPPQQEVTQQVVVINRPLVSAWKHDLCGCFDDMEASCLAYCVPCVQYGLNAEALGHDCCAYGCLFALAASFGLPCIAGMVLREEIRNRRGIEGDGCNDCLVWTFLGCCALVQEAQELKEMQREPQIQQINRT